MQVAFYLRMRTALSIKEMAYAEDLSNTDEIIGGAEGRQGAAGGGGVDGTIVLII